MKPFYDTLSKHSILLLLIFTIPLYTFAQVGINTITPADGSILDISSANKGVLFPRVDISNLGTIAPITGGAPDGLVVYNTNTSTGPGLFAWNTSVGQWLSVDGDKNWRKGGNGNTSPGTGLGDDYIGTSDNVAFEIGTNGESRARFEEDGQVTIGYGSIAALTGQLVGILTDIPDGTALAAYSNALGNAVYGEVPSGLGVWGNVANGRGVYGTSTTTGQGVRGFNSGDGFGVVGNNSATGIGVIGFGTGTGIGVQAQNDGAYPALFAVNNTMLTNVAGLMVGAEFDYQGADIDDHTGGFGFSDPDPGNNWGVGLEGWGGYIGVLGLDLSGLGFGLFSIGDSGSSGGKSFVIDHPTDPENKFLKHFSLESNEVLNIYRGTINLDSNGSAIVELPIYYESINKNASFQLTPIGAPMPNLYIAKEIENGEFKISGGAPNKKVSWIVTAERNDPYFQQYPEKRQTIIDKDSRRGKYLMPHLFNQPETKGMFYKEIHNKDKVIIDKGEDDVQFSTPSRKNN